ncbi:MAG TPA: NIL domain-containing protein [bacterium]|nr:NIL domain-containing protein [bacterium]
MGLMKKLIELDYPTGLVTEPVLSLLIRKHDILLNIRRASITKGFGYVQAEISGEESEVKKALADLTAQGIDVNPIEKDVVE